MVTRQPYLKIWEELARDKSMVFLVGPRQVGKTTLAKDISRSFVNNLYFNWDIPADKARITENPAFFQEIKRRDPSTPLIIFDEIHKYKDWKNYLKGVYDEFHEEYQFLVSGSGRLDIYQKGGDSLAGRYLLFHLWPFTISELGKRNLPIDDFLENPIQISLEGSGRLRKEWSRLSMQSGFPEPFLANRAVTYRRWSNTYSSQLIREDIRDLTGIKSVSDMETLYSLLPSKVGAPLSVPSLASDLKVSYNSIRGWLSAFERFFLIFTISPWTESVARAIQKERKIYLWDAPRIEEPAPRFENMVAIELWRAATNWNDLGYGNFSLHFIRNKEHQEVDFLIANRGKPVALIEAKMSDATPSSTLKKFQNALRIPAVQLIDEDEGHQIFSNNDRSILVAPGHQWLSQLP